MKISSKLPNNGYLWNCNNKNIYQFHENYKCVVNYQKLHAILSSISLNLEIDLITDQSTRSVHHLKEQRA